MISIVQEQRLDELNLSGIRKTIGSKVIGYGQKMRDPQAVSATKLRQAVGTDQSIRSKYYGGHKRFADNPNTKNANTYQAKRFGDMAKTTFATNRSLAQSNPGLQRGRTVRRIGKLIKG